MKIVKIIFLFFSLVLISFANGGKGDLDITVDLKPVSPTKKYYIDSSILLDAGTFNAKSLVNRIKLADVTVKMVTRESNNSSGNDYCVIDGDFTDLYDLSKFSSLNGKEITTSELTKYYVHNGNNNIGMKLYEENFKLTEKEIINPVITKNTYSFSAYPEECMKKNGENIIKSLEYSFEIWLEVSGVRSGEIVRTDVNINKNEIRAEADGAIKDLVEQHFSELAKK